jgi:hypothetical protein
MRLIIEIAVVVWLLSRVAAAYDDGYRDGTNTCEVRR